MVISEVYGDPIWDPLDPNFPEVHDSSRESTGCDPT